MAFGKVFGFVFSPVFSPVFGEDGGDIGTWILETGFWDDNAFWDDDDFWNDSTSEELFLDAGLGITLNGSNVADWDDQSLFINNAVQGNASFQPFFLSNGLNGEPALSFEAAEFLSIASSDSMNIDSDFTVYFVLSVIAVSARGVLIGKDSGDTSGYEIALLPGAFIEVKASDGVEQTNTSLGSFPLNEVIILGIHYVVGGEVDFTIDGNSIGPSNNTLTAIATDGTDTLIGAGSTVPVDEVEADLGTVKLFSTALDTSRRDEVGTALAAQYGLTWKPSPTDIPGIVAQYAGDLGVTETAGDVSGWDDQSVNANNAVQASSANQPVFSATGFNGRAAIDFEVDGPDDSVVAPDSASLDITGDFTFYAAIQFEDLAPFPTWISRNQVNGYAWRVRSNGIQELRLNDGSGLQTISSTTPVPVGVPMILEVRCNIGGTCNFTRDGVDIGNPTNTLTGLQSNSNSLIIGGTDGVGGAMDGLVAEILMFDELLATSNRNKALSYLGIKYGLTWTPIT